MTEKQFIKACSQFFKATPFAANPKKETVIANGILYACSSMSGKPRFFEIAQVNQ